ncbi:hypothetical protein AUJ66_08675 [Candidatus Desantisbacteria bacterium CG1_02_38_46]|uniref:Ferredoxin n=3 Tax=unclassified Candidatus Desantisiibacteriota TaxID=3106372 RepID=A0A2H9PB02_9BACT|nr:MAG: hypothetical protein AUJ66_08675 [Candidatus Desantisbacteria bacterium CG1_02_38_46]PIU51978.1 MAG: ferredoxin [Candidatus Desantisbacteria bacterium CG07_land_8_20_14_0_80_39_15]PIZ15831.1 MAG: ferredoxin [Candidatus Desantisbacteria bacterium CG_4_10_14_0_8_um_filter_39_17]
MAEEKKSPVIDKEMCTGCEICIDECPNKALELVDDIASVVRVQDCDGCGKCAESCPNEAITMK